MESLKNLAVTLACFLGAGGGGYLLYQDLTASSMGGKGKPMATLEKREAKVRRKAADSYIWARAETAQPLYRKDSIQTGPGSMAVVRFNDQSLLEVGEESLIVIDDIQNLSLNFVRGSLVLRSEKGDRKLSVDASGKIKTEELPLRLLKPEPQAHTFSEEGMKKEITFQWEIKKTAGAQTADLVSSDNELQVSPDRSFSSSRTIRYRIEDVATTSTALSFLPGNYFWRIKAPQKPLTEVRKFQISTATALRPVWPLSTTAPLKTWKEESALPFRWMSSKEGEHFLEVGTDSDFQNKVKTEKIAAPTGQALLTGIQEGNYFWRIRSQYGDLELKSKAEKFSIEKNQKLAIEPLYPQSGHSVEVRKELRFHWKAPVVQGLEFQFELLPATASSSTSKKQWIERTPATTYAWKNLEPGSYRWRAIAMHQKEVAGESPWQNFHVFQGKPIQLLFPKQNQAIHYWDAPSPFRFEWEKDTNPGAKGLYRLALASDAEFKTKLAEGESVENALESSKLPLQPGMYYWRIGVLDPQGEVTKWSATQKFSYGVFPPLEPPSEAEPRPGAVFDVVRMEQDPVLSWSKVKDAQAYEVTVTDPSAPKEKILLQKVISAQSLQVSGLKEGKYTWTVRPIDPLKRLGTPLLKRGFEVSYGKPLEAPETLTPEVQ